MFSLIWEFPLYSRQYKRKKQAIQNTENNISANNDDDFKIKFAHMEHNPMQDIICKPCLSPYPLTATDDPNNLIEVNLENTDLANLLNWISDTFEVNFLTDDAIQPLPTGGKTVAGNKITFKTHKPLTKKQVWNLFLTFLDFFGFGLVEGTIPNLYKVRPTAINAPGSVNRSPLDSYINIHWEDLPDNDTHIRYIYFVRNTTLATIQGIVDAFRSTTATLKPLQDLNAFVLTDKASNIRSLMQIVTELDSIASPEAMSVLKLKNADAEDVVKLYNNLTKFEDPRGLAARILGPKKTSPSVYFPETTRLIAERRNNILIILGDIESIKKVEEFIINHIDVELKVPYSPLYVYELQYASAGDIASILTDVTRFAQGTAAAQTGGVREGDKYLQPMTFKAEPSGNRLLIKAEKEDYLKVRDIIKQLDVRQPQIAIEVLIVNVISADNKEIGVQIRNKNSNTINGSLDFQTSGFPLAGGNRAAPVINPTTGSIMADLIQLARNQTPGATLISISNAASGVWAIFKLLQNHAHTNLISNPFLITTNKYQSEVSIGETRRVMTGIVKGATDTPVFDDVTANLTLRITPQINTIGMINLEISISIDNFIDTADPTSANRNTKTVVTNANVGNQQVLALGGLLETVQNESLSKVPILGDIPLVGWFFKNRVKVKRKDNLLIFISPRIVEPRLAGGINQYTKDKATSAKESLCGLRHPAEMRDPIHKWFFNDVINENTEYVDNFLAKQNPEQCIDIPESLYCQEPCLEVSNCCIAQNDEYDNQSTTIALENSKPKSKKRSITELVPLNNQEVVT
ncbi:MAG: secretin N-terminal domain-containing protein [Candidatus Babeliales bacterium]